MTAGKHFLIFALAVLCPRHTAAAAPDDLTQQRCPRLKQFAIVFSFGYAGDSMPKEDAAFGDLLAKIAKAGFNTIHCTFTEKRLESCKKHGLLMMVDLLAEEQHHVYKSPDKAKAICEKLRNHPQVWGYNIWNDVYRKTTPGRIRDINTVREWDPTHPAYSGTYRTDGMSSLNNPDIFGYYDFHWKRGLDQHLPHLLAYANWAKQRNAWFYSWLAVTSGQAGKGNFNRSLWSANTAIACGQKGIMWFLGTELMNTKTFEWTEFGSDIAKVNARLAPLTQELTKFGNPTAIHATPITKNANNEAIPEGKKNVMSSGLEKSTFPADGPIQPLSGEFIMGSFEESKQKSYFIANLNAYAPQSVQLKFIKAKSVERFDRDSGKWKTLMMKDSVVEFPLEPAGGELLRAIDN